MSLELANRILVYVAFTYILWTLGRLVFSTYQRRKQEERDRHEWASIQRQIREARTVEEKRVASERFAERLKRVS